MIANLPDLRKLSGLKRRSDVRRWLTANGVAFMVQPSGDPVTTLDAINIAMHGTARYNKPDFSPPPGSRNFRAPKKNVTPLLPKSRP